MFGSLKICHIHIQAMFFTQNLFLFCFIPGACKGWLMQKQKNWSPTFYKSGNWSTKKEVESSYHFQSKQKLLWKTKGYYVFQYAMHINIFIHVFKTISIFCRKNVSIFTQHWHWLIRFLSFRVRRSFWRRWKAVHTDFVGKVANNV